MNELFNRLVIIETNHGYSRAFVLNCSLHTLMARYVALCSHLQISHLYLCLRRFGSLKSDSVVINQL